MLVAGVHVGIKNQGSAKTLMYPVAEDTPGFANPPELKINHQVCPFCTGQLEERLSGLDFQFGSFSILLWAQMRRQVTNMSDLSTRCRFHATRPWVNFDLICIAINKDLNAVQGRAFPFPNLKPYMSSFSARPLHHGVKACMWQSGGWLVFLLMGGGICACVSGKNSLAWLLASLFPCTHWLHIGIKFLCFPDVAENRR